MPASYLSHLPQLEAAIAQSAPLLDSCVLCPRRCGVARSLGETGFCEAGFLPKVYSYFPHTGEEPPISGTSGSGTVFFSHCTLQCCYCQNFQFSCLGEGLEKSFEELAGIMLNLQARGCHNLNLVTPTHFMPQILRSLDIAIREGFRLPIVYNTSGYECTSILKMLDGLVDVYLPDMRYGDPQMAARYSQAPNYPEHNQEAVKEMFRQVGLPAYDEEGIIQRGLVVRHLVLPGEASGTRKILQFLRDEISPEIPISLMSQYQPYFRASKHLEINRPITAKEYEQAMQWMEELGLDNGWFQPSGGSEDLAGVHFSPTQ